MFGKENSKTNTSTKLDNSIPPLAIINNLVFTSKYFLVKVAQGHGFDHKSQRQTNTSQRHNRMLDQYCNIHADDVVLLL